jgi:hypothetical protein
MNSSRLIDRIQQLNDMVDQASVVLDEIQAALSAMEIAYEGGFDDADVTIHELDETE